MPVTPMIRNRDKWIARVSQPDSLVKIVRPEKVKGRAEEGRGSEKNV